MSHTIHSYQQGSSQWHSHRATHFNASEAPAMMGASKFTSRSELLREKATGVPREHDEATQRRFAAGHEAEAHVRAKVEQITGTDFFPVTASCVVDGLPLSASYDGLTMDETIGLEVKLWNEGLAEQVRAGALDMHYVWQLEQQLLVVGAEVIIFCTGDADRLEKMEYRAVPGRREQLIAGWKQFQADLATYTPPAASAVEKIVAEPVEALPAPVVQVTGQLALTDNFGIFEARLRDFLEHKLIREPKTDQDFVDLDAQIKAMKQARESVKGAKAQMLAQIDPVDRASKTADMLDKMLQQNLAMAEKILASEKERRKGEIVAVGIAALREHIAGLNVRIGQPYMPASATAVDFGAVIKGLRSLDSMENAIATTLANAKIAASAIADKIEINLKALPGLVGDRTGLTPDLQQLVLKSADDFAAVVGQRVAAQREQEERRAAALAEQQRERIRKEEEARAAEKVRMEQEAAAREQRAREEAEALERRQREAAAAPTPAPSAAPVAAPVAANVVPMPTKAPAAPATPPSLKLGQISERLGFTVTADFLARMGFPIVATDKSAKLYHEAQFSPMVDSIIAHLRTVQQQQQAA